MLARLSAVFLLLCLKESLGVSEEFKQMAAMLHETCVEETGVDESLIAEVNAGKFVENDKLKCYMKCILVELSSMTDDGMIDVDTIVEMLPDDMKLKAEPIIRGCGTVKGTDDCDTAFLTQKCYYESNPSDFVLI